MFFSVSEITLSIPVPRSSQIPILLSNEAKISFLDLGGESKNLSTLIKGVPGLTISILFSNISITGPVPLIVKSWCMRALATNSLIANSGYTGIVSLNALHITSLLGKNSLIKLISPSNPVA